MSGSRLAFPIILLASAAGLAGWAVPRDQAEQNAASQQFQLNAEAGQR
jgi:hypothetical protein